jgi:hypothetical protein
LIEDIVLDLEHLDQEIIAQQATIELSVGAPPVLDESAFCRRVARSSIRKHDTVFCGLICVVNQHEISTIGQCGVVSVDFWIVF